MLAGGITGTLGALCRFLLCKLVQGILNIVGASSVSLKAKELEINFVIRLISFEIMIIESLIRSPIPVVPTKCHSTMNIYMTMISLFITEGKCDKDPTPWLRTEK